MHRFKAICAVGYVISTRIYFAQTYLHTYFTTILRFSKYHLLTKNRINFFAFLLKFHKALIGDHSVGSLVRHPRAQNELFSLSRACAIVVVVVVVYLLFLL